MQMLHNFCLYKICAEKLAIFQARSFHLMSTVNEDLFADSDSDLNVNNYNDSELGQNIAVQIICFR
jgi:hypothetical protein